MRATDSAAVRRDLEDLDDGGRRVYLDQLRYDGIYDQIATHMRILIRGLGTTQRDVAAAMGTSETALSRLLRGTSVRRVKLETLVRFARALDVEIEDLLADPSVVIAARRPLPAAWTGRRVSWHGNVAYAADFVASDLPMGADHPDAAVAA